MKLNIKTIILFFIIINLIICEILMDKTNIIYFRYIDEFLACAFLIYNAFYILKHKKIRMLEFKVLVSCVSIFILGILSNILYLIQADLYTIVLDIISCFKIPIILIGFYNILDKNTAENLVRLLVIPAKIFILTGFICSIISLFINIGMRGQYRFGIWGFNFIFKYAFSYALVLIFNLIVIVISKDKKINIYKFFTSIQLFLSLKGPAMITAILIFIIPALIKKKNKISKKHLLLVLLLSLVLGNYQIKTYLTNENAPRYLLFKYSFITANEYFPLGSGFATFGSDMAAKEYSELYYKYGFNALNGMSKEDTKFLNDNYWPMVIGQFGYIGCFFVLFILYNLFKYIQNLKIDYEIKAIFISSYVYMLISSIGNSIYTISGTAIMMIGIIIAFKIDDKDKEV